MRAQGLHWRSFLFGRCCRQKHHFNFIYSQIANFPRNMFTVYSQPCCLLKRTGRFAKKNQTKGRCQKIRWKWGDKEFPVSMVSFFSRKVLHSFVHLGFLRQVQRRPTRDFLCVLGGIFWNQRCLLEFQKVSSILMFDFHIACCGNEYQSTEKSSFWSHFGWHFYRFRAHTSPRANVAELTWGNAARGVVFSGETSGELCRVKPQTSKNQPQKNWSRTFIWSNLKIAS